MQPSTEVLDVGAGTGVIGTLLNKKQGFNNMFAIEPSDVFVEKLRTSGYYKKVTQ